MTDSDLTALVLVCSLKPSPARSSSELLGTQLLEAMAPHGVSGRVIRVLDHDVKPGVETDMGDGDEWPTIRAAILAADILVIATPTWMGQHSSVCMRVLERLDAELSETDDQGRPQVYPRVAALAVVGNEDGAHHITADVFQALGDVGFTVPAQAVTYLNGAAMQKTDYQDLAETPSGNRGRHQARRFQRRPPGAGPARPPVPAGQLNIPRWPPGSDALSRRAAPAARRRTCC